MTELHVETKRRAPWKSTLGSEKKPAYGIHRNPATMSMMQASNDIYRNCKETLISIVEASLRVSLACSLTKVQAVNRIVIWLMKIASKAIYTQALEN